MLTTNSGVNLTEFTIPLVTDNLQGQQITCIAMAGETTYTETVGIQVEGMTVCSGCRCYCDLHACPSVQSQLALWWQMQLYQKMVQERLAVQGSL